MNDPIENDRYKEDKTYNGIPGFENTVIVRPRRIWPQGTRIKWAVAGDFTQSAGYTTAGGQYQCGQDFENGE